MSKRIFQKKIFKMSIWVRISMELQKSFLLQEAHTHILVAIMEWQKSFFAIGSPYTNVKTHFSKKNFLNSKQIRESIFSVWSFRNFFESFSKVFRKSGESSAKVRWKSGLKKFLLIKIYRKNNFSLITILSFSLSPFPFFFLSFFLFFPPSHPKIYRINIHIL